MEYSVETNVRRLGSIVNRSTILLKTLNRTLDKELDCAEQITIADALGNALNAQNLIAKERELKNYRLRINNELNYLNSQIPIVNGIINAQLDELRVVATLNLS